jgi:hypothetical protein
VRQRHYWSLGIFPAHEEEGTGVPLDDAYLDQMIGYLRQWEAERILPGLHACSPATLCRGYCGQARVQTG